MRFAVVARLGLLAGWTWALVLDTDCYVATMGALADVPAVQDAIADAAGRIAATQPATLAERTSPPVPGNATIRNAAHAVVAPDEVSARWKIANEVAHTQVVAILTGDDVLGLRAAGGRVVMDLDAILTAIASRLSSLGYEADFEAAFANAPAFLSIFASRELDSAPPAVGRFYRVVTLLPVGCLALLIGAPHRWRALRRAGIGLAIGSGVVLILLIVGSRHDLDAFGRGVPRDAPASAFDVLTRRRGCCR